MEAGLLNLPLQIQIAAASGYAAYMTSNVGIRGHHTATETAFGAALYGLIASAILAAAPQRNSIIVTGAVAFCLTLFAGMFWRKIGCILWMRVLAYLEVSRADDSPSAWMALQQTADTVLTQLTVELDDGTKLICDDTSKFKGAPFAPCVMGANGDVAMYLTHENKDGRTREVTTTRGDLDWGDRLTYIPAGNIRRVSFRQRATH